MGAGVDKPSFRGILNFRPLLLADFFHLNR
jgi:hypothetical protein